LPKKTKDNIEKLEKIFSEEKPSLIIFKRKCIQAMRRKLYTKVEKVEA